MNYDDYIIMCDLPYIHYEFMVHLAHNRTELLEGTVHHAVWVLKREQPEQISP